MPDTLEYIPGDIYWNEIVAAIRQVLNDPNAPDITELYAALVNLQNAIDKG